MWFCFQGVQRETGGMKWDIFSRILNIEQIWWLAGAFYLTEIITNLLVSIELYLILWYKLFYKQRLFSTQPQCWLTFYWTESEMLLKCCLLHRGIALRRHTIFYIFVSMSTYWSIYALFKICFLIITFIFIKINHIISKTCLSKVQPQGVA